MVIIVPDKQNTKTKTSAERNNAQILNWRQHSLEIWLKNSLMPIFQTDIFSGLDMLDRNFPF